MTTRRRHPLLTIVLAVSLGLGAGAMVVQSVGAFGLFEALIARTAIRSIGVKIQERKDRAEVNRQRDRRLAAVAAREAALEVRLGLSAEAAERERARFAQMREAIKQTALRERQIISYKARRRIDANLRGTIRDAIKAAIAVDPRAIDALIGMFEGKKPLKAMLEAALSEQPEDPRQAFRDLRERLRDVQRAASAIGGAKAIDIKARIRQALLEASGLADGDGPIPDDVIQRFRELLDARRGVKDALAAFVDDLVPGSPGIDEERFAHDPRWRERMATIRALNAPEAKARLVSSLLSRSIARIEAIAGEAGIALTDEQFERIAREVLTAWINERYEDGRVVRGKVVDIDRLVRHAINESLGARGLALLPEPAEPELFSGSGYAEFVGEAAQVDRANDPKSKTECTGNVPIRAAVSWSPDTTRVEITYHRFNVMGLPREIKRGGTTEQLKCLQGGRQVTHRGGFDRTTGALDRLDGRGTPPELVDVAVGWDPSEEVVSLVGGDLAASDVFNSWKLSFELASRCSGGYGLADFTAANTREELDARAFYAAQDRPSSGVIITGCTLDLVSPPDGPLELSFGDLPEWAQDQLVTVGAAAECSDAPARVLDGDPLVLVDGLPVARVGDPTDGDGTIITGSSTIFVNGEPAAFIAAC